jgi:hypothetical protein
MDLLEYVTRSAMRYFGDGGRLNTFTIHQQLEYQKLEAEQSLPGQTDGTDRSLIVQPLILHFVQLSWAGRHSTPAL